MSEIPEARPASTVVLLRETRQGLETLLLKRNKALMFAGGFWVFPGGAVDPQDMDQADGDEQLGSRLAAAREAQEESGLQPRLEDMVLLSHWTTPVVEPRRFSTWVYAAPLLADHEVVIDGGEIHDSRWIPVAEAIALHEAGELAVLPPTYVTLRRVAAYDSLQQLIDMERESPAPEVMPVLADDDGQLVAMFRGDAGYASGDPGAAGPRHRTVLVDKRWQYLYEDVDPRYPAMIDWR